MRWIVAIVVAVAVGVVAAMYLFPGAIYRGAMKLERSIAGLETRAVTVADLNIVYTDRGQGEPLLLLHGFTADKDHWTRVARHLDASIRVIAPDLPGFGESTRDAALDYAIPKQVARIDAFVERIGLQRFHIGGSSMGGNIAMAFAARHPEKVLSLWLLAPGGVQSTQRSDMEQVLFAGGPHPLIPVDREGFEQTLQYVFVDAPFVPAPLRDYLAREAAARQQLREQIFSDLLNPEGTAVTPLLNDLAPSITQPALIVWGDSDRILHPSGGRVLAELMPNAQLDVMTNTGHLPMLEAPRRTAERYNAFRSSLQ